MTLTEFLLARLAEDEALARDAIGPHETDDAGHWEWVEYAYEGGSPEPRGSLVRRHVGGGYDPGYPWTDLVNHFDPARVLADVEAKRRIVEVSAAGAMPNTDEWAQVAWDVLCDLTGVYADHPDWQEEWRV